ncbi:MAG: CPBP family intramembrane metalloprotease [Planctomycetes bacterium]|nr:CPBP family intramembrane metalloprotease [Planctomycetota bacterium]
MTGIVLSGFSVALSCLALGGLSLFLDSSHWGPSAAAGLAGMSSGMLFFLAVLLFPLYETFVGQVLPIEIARRLGVGSVGCALISGGVFGVGHFLNGGGAHGVTTSFAGSVFAFGYVLVRHVGFRASYVTAATAHAMHNAVLMLALLLFPQLR